MDRNQAIEALRNTLIYKSWDLKIAWCGVLDALLGTELKVLEEFNRECWILDELKGFSCMSCGVWLGSKNETLYPGMCDNCYMFGGPDGPYYARP